MASIWRENVLGYLAIFVLGHNLYLKASVCFSEQILSTDKNPSIFSRQMGAIASIFVQYNCEFYFSSQPYCNNEKQDI